MFVDVTVVHVVGGPVARASDIRLREPGFESCAAVSNLGQVSFNLHCSSSLGCINVHRE